VLLKWYHTYFEEGKYQQAKQVAELARELAPDDPQVASALKLAQRQEAKTESAAKVETQLERVLIKLDRVERQLRSTQAQKQRRIRIQLATEPPGSPDAFSPALTKSFSSTASALVAQGVERRKTA
jgi:hypothetical protein